MERIIETGHAKINLALDILGKRADGYHEVRMVMQSISLADTVVLTESKGLSLQVEGSALPCDRRNLAYQAAELLAERFGKTADVRIELKKRIFVAAGLAGGSSDAAAVLRGLNRLWQLELTAEELEELAAKLGSDVPFCICGGTALAEGRGEILTALPAPQEAVLVLAKPQASLSTAKIYAAYDKTEIEQRPAIDSLLVSLRNKENALPLCGMGNVLEPVAIGFLPIIDEIKQTMLRAGARYALMSGSGPTVFAVAADTAAADKIMKQLQKMQLETAIAVTAQRRERV